MKASIGAYQLTKDLRMSSFNFKRFLNVARWDLTINSKFYTRAAILMLALTCTPILLYYLHSMLYHNYYLTANISDNIDTFCAIISLLGCAYMIISSGYMFHNLLTKQGRINELTLPATNLERFLWHFVVIVIGVNILWLVGVVFADLLHALFRLAIPGAEIKSITAILYVDAYTNWDDFHMLGKHAPGIMLFLVIMLSSYCRSFALVNAWKYRYNIPLTFLFYFILQNVIALLSIFIIFHVFDSPDTVRDFWNWLHDGAHFSIVLTCMNIFAALLYIGIWLLTYRLYTRAQITTKRNP